MTSTAQLDRPMPHPHSIASLWPLYQRYIYENLIPLAKRRPDLYGPPTSPDVYLAARDALKRLMDEDPYALEGIPSEAMGGIAWIAAKAVGLIQTQSDSFPDIEGETEDEQLRALLKAVWPASALLHMPEPPGLAQTMH